MKKLYLAFVIFFLIISSCKERKKTWTNDQIKYKETFLEFCNELDTKKVTDLNSNSVTLKNIIQKYIHYRKDINLDSASLGLYSYVMKGFHHIVDSIGSKNLDAKPIIYYKKNKDFFKPFTGNLKKNIPNVLAYYHKNHPQKPIATILFDQKSHKIISWMIMKKGDYCFYF
ncbi:MAG: hypothetical protein ACK476_10730 [Fluviicola sp.]|jgi:hypothetical protein